jgi:2-methylcitrate dehydratase PrpD
VKARPAPDPEASLRRLGRWASQLRFDDIPGEVVEAAKGQIFSVLAAAHAGYASDLGPQIRAAFGARCGTGAHAMPAGIATGPAHAAFLTACWSMVHDYDDIMLGGHASHSTVLVPFAYGEALGSSGRELLLAQIAANEVAGRLNMSVALGKVRGQMAGHLHLVGAAAARARLEGLDGEDFAHALGFALAQPPRSLYGGFLGSDAKALCAAWPIRMGLDAVDAVKAGLRGNPAIVDEPGGFMRSIAAIPVPGFIDGLGERWHTATNSIKLYPSCGYLNAVLDATLDLVREHDIAATDVEAVEVRGSLFTLGMDAHSAPYLAGPDSLVPTLTFSTPYTVASAILHRRFAPEHLDRAHIRDPRVWALAQRVRVVHDMDQTIAAVLADIPIGAALKLAGRGGALRFLVGMGGTPLLGKLLLTQPLGLLRLVAALARLPRKGQPPDFARATKSLGAGVKIRIAGGRSVEREVAIPRGFAGSAPIGELVGLARRKFVEQAVRVVGQDRAAQAAALIDRLETLQPAELQALVRLNGAAAQAHRDMDGARLSPMT